MFRFLLCVALFLSLKINDLSAQIGVGVHVGDPTGLSVQWRGGGSMAGDLLVAYNLDDYLFASLHGLWFKPLDSGQKLSFYYGPGAYLYLRGDDWRGRWRDEDGDARLGISGNFGLSLRVSRLDFFLQLTPRFSVFPATGFGAGGGLGGRFWF
jgi:hypothetical protein